MSGLVPIEKYLNLSLTECPLALGDFFLEGGRIPAVVAPKHCFMQIDKCTVLSPMFSCGKESIMQSRLEKMILVKSAYCDFPAAGHTFVVSYKQLVLVAPFVSTKGSFLP
jgi:hypothetical protein